MAGAQSRVWRGDVEWLERAAAATPQAPGFYTLMFEIIRILSGSVERGLRQIPVKHLLVMPDTGGVGVRGCW